MTSKLVPETVISASIRDYLNNRGFTVWRNNVGTFRVGRNIIRNGVKGSPDLIGFTPEGYFLGVEVKREGKQLTHWQKLFATKIRATKNGIYIVARSIEDVREKLDIPHAMSV